MGVLVGVVLAIPLVAALMVMVPMLYVEDVLQDPMDWAPACPYVQVLVTVVAARRYIGAKSAAQPGDVEQGSKS
jgi:hypothetical protein